MKVIASQWIEEILGNEGENIVTSDKPLAIYVVILQVVVEQVELRNYRLKYINELADEFDITDIDASMFSGDTPEDGLVRFAPVLYTYILRLRNCLEEEYELIFSSIYTLIVWIMYDMYCD